MGGYYVPVNFVSDNYIMHLDRGKETSMIMFIKIQDLIQSENMKIFFINQSCLDRFSCLKLKGMF